MTLLATTSTLFPYTTLFRSIAAADFVIAWEESIQKASEVSQVGGFMVSEHFCRLARSRLETRRDPPPDQQRLTDLLAHESKDRKSTRLNSSHLGISYAVFCL